MENLLEFHSIYKNYGNKKALDSISFNVPKDSIFCVLGPNGAGKTTLIKGLLGLIKIDSGQIIYNGHNGLTIKDRRGISFLPERFSFFPYYKVHEVIRFYAQMRGLKNLKPLDEICYEVLDLKNILDKKVSSLSKGQMQRLGLACCFVGNPQLILMDEPFSGLDPIGIVKVREFLKLQKKEGRTIIINSHLLTEMEKIADQFILINEGILLEQSSVAPLRRSETSLEDHFIRKLQEARV